MEPLPDRHIDLPNGLCLKVADATRHYFGGYWLVAMEAKVVVPVDQACFDSPTAWQDARGMLGDSVEFVSRIEKMAVPSADIDAVREGILERVSGHVIPLVSSERFPRRFLATEYRKRMNKKSRGIPCLS